MKWAIWSSMQWGFNYGKWATSSNPFHCLKTGNVPQSQSSLILPASCLFCNSGISQKVYSLELESAQTPIFAFKQFSLERLLVPGVLGWVRSPLLNRWLSSHYNSPMGGGILSWTPVIIRIILRHWSQNNKNYKLQTHMQNHWAKKLTYQTKTASLCEWKLSWS